MEWWNEFVDWFLSADARPVLFSAAVLLVAIIVAGLLSAWIAKGAMRGLMRRTEREQKASAIATLVDAATEASVWNSLTPQEQVLSDRAVGQADILMRLLPIKSSGLAANWASHQLAEMKRNSATFGYQLDPAIIEFRDRLVDWQNKPSRARKIFQNDLERWRYESNSSEQQLVNEQDAWVARQHHEQHSQSEAKPEPLTPAGVGENTVPQQEGQPATSPRDAYAARAQSAQQNHTGPTNTVSDSK